MKQITAFLTFDDELFKDEAEAKEHEKVLIDDVKKLLCKSEKFVYIIMIVNSVHLLT